MLLDISIPTTGQLFVITGQQWSHTSLQMYVEDYNEMKWPQQRCLANPRPD